MKASEVITREKQAWEKYNADLHKAIDDIFEKLILKSDIKNLMCSIKTEQSTMYDSRLDEYYPLDPREGDTMTDEEGSWYFEDGQWWLE